MAGLNADEEDEDERASGKNEDDLSNAYSPECSYSHVQLQHRRTKSATNKKLDVSKVGSSSPDQNKSHAVPPPRRSSEAQSSHPVSQVKIADNFSNQQASLEKDVEQLQQRLQQEKCMRNTLERAIGRASSALSPGHRHFSAQTKELIKEIELLEEEVSKREKHVLSLYRNIFEQCTSRPPSGQSSSLASPAHTKREQKKHPSIISTAFCSSKNFRLRPFQSLVSTNESGKRTSLSQSKSRHASASTGRTRIQFEKSYSSPVKAHDKVTVKDKTSVQTLKDHLHQCPSKLSEEMVRCMAAVYFWLRKAAANADKSQSPQLSRSSTSVLPRQVIGEDRIWSCKSMVEVSWIAKNKNQFSHASYAIDNYRFLVEQLERVNLGQMGSNAQIAFWINVCNSLIMHAYLAYGIPHSSLRRLTLFHKAAYKISGHVISANTIEQSIIGFRTPRIGRWLETILSTAMRKRYGEDRQCISSKFGLKDSVPLVCFALCTGASSDPMLNVYTAENVQEELELAKKEFLQANIVVKKSKKVFLPKLIDRFAKETSIGSDDIIRWVTENVDNKLCDYIQNCVERKTDWKASQVIEWLPYNPQFRYVFSKDLIEKPWWV